MPSPKRAKLDADHSFHAIYDKDVKWEDGLAMELLTLPKGVKVKVFTHDPITQRIDMKIKFPKGYVEPVVVGPRQP
ncbi:MAG: hypothetical protein ACE5MI_10835 [Acidimicrobiia bacterium]